MYVLIIKMLSAVPSLKKKTTRKPYLPDALSSFVDEKKTADSPSSWARINYL